MAVYIGPYIILKRKEITSFRTIKVNPKTGIEVRGNFSEGINYDPNTGDRLIEKILTESEYGFVLYDMADFGLDEDMFSFPEYWAGNNKTHELAIINKDRFNLAKYFDRYEHKIIEYESIVPNLDSFKELYSDYIEFFTEKSESVKIGFGIVTT